MLHLCSLIPLSLTSSIDLAALFSDFKKEFGKQYATVDLEASAFSAFVHNDQIIKETNAKGLSYKLGHNEHSDKTWEQFFTSGFKPSAKSGVSRSVHEVDASEELASSVDWVASGAVTPVKNQGSCGSCWSFSTTGAIEGAYQIATGSLLSLSEEDLVQCSKSNSGCNGGSMDLAFKWVQSNGIASEAAYPYTSSGGTTGSCSSAERDTPVVTVSGYVDVPSESALKSAVAKQPVSIAIEADKSAFQLYSSGVFTSSSCGTNVDHGVLVVGYGTEDGTAYWKVKNSWGTTWGESGYIRMERGVNMCGIATEPSYPKGATAYSSSSSLAEKEVVEMPLAKADEQA